MSAIDFVVSGDAGVAQRGSLTGVDGSNSVIVATGQDLSLNLQRGDVLSFVRLGQALQVTLMDGRTILVEGFFTPEGAAIADLFISANGQLSQVDLVAGEGNLLYAQYVDSDNFGKWSPDDDLYFVRGSEVQLAGVVADDSAGMLATGLLGGLGGLAPMAGLGAAGLGGALLLGGSGGASAGDGAPDETGGTEPGDGTGGAGGGNTNPGGGEGLTPPVVTFTKGTKGTDYTIDGDDRADGVTVTGSGTPGASGTVTVGDVTKDISIGEDGSWTVEFTPEEVEGGEYETEITVTVTNGGGTTTVTDALVVDTITSVTFDASSVEGEGTVNFTEESDGVTLSGSTEVGAKVVVTFGGQSYDATVTDSSWSLDVPAGMIAGGEYDLDITVTATDSLGNTASTTDTVRIDTVTTVSVNTITTANDGVVNAEAHAAGVTINGLAEAGATVVVTAGGVSKTVTATSSGTWSATYSSSEIAEGTYDLAVTAVSTDLAGNTASAQGTLHVDTELSVTVDTAGIEGDGTVTAVERADGITLTGTTEANASVNVAFGGMTVAVTADSSGNWSADFPAGAVPEGELNSQVTVTATDAVGNTASTTGLVNIDTEISVTIDTTNVKTDGIVNGVERNEGLTLTGTTDANASVLVSFAGVSRTVTADADGNWAASWPKGAIPTGELNAPVTAVATDAAGNTASASGAVKIDTLVNRLAANGPVEGDDMVNVAEASDGITLTGVVEAGSKVVVNFEGIAREATVTAAGNWSVTYAASEIRSGEYTANVAITATDKVGNTASITDTFAVDTLAPDAPDIEDYTDSVAGVKGFTILETDADVTVDQITLGGTAVSKTFNASTFDGETSIRFGSGNETPDGSHLVITAADDAGNANSTLFILDDTASSDVNLPAGVLSGYNIGAIDLELAEETNLTLSTADLKALSNNDDTLIIHGGSDDTVTLTGPATGAGSKIINGQSYAVYTLGDDDTTLIINDQIGFTAV